MSNQPRLMVLYGVVVSLCAGTSQVEAQRTLAAPMLSGAIHTAAGGQLEGVAVSARARTRTFTTTVFTDEQGAYLFPPLENGEYRVWAQAVGYDAGRATVNVDTMSHRRQDFTLQTIDDFTSQLSGTEWMAALPEDTPERRRMKQIFENNCTGCHQPEFVLQNRFDETGWHAIVTAMETAQSTGSWVNEPWPIIRYHKDELVAWLTEMRGPGPSPMTFTLHPRPTGEAARVVITEYDVPPAETPDRLAPHDGSDWSEGAPSAYWAKGLHDVVADFDGNAWLNDSITNGNRTYAKVDTKTGEVTNFKVPTARGGARGSHAITTGPDGYVWLNLYGDRSQRDSEGTGGVGELGRIDPRTETLEIYTPPKGMPGVGGHIEIDGQGKVWAVSRGAVRFDPETEEFTHFTSPTLESGRRSASTYGVGADSDGNGWWAIITHDRLGVSDIESGGSTEVQLPPRHEMQSVVTTLDREFYRSLLGDATSIQSNHAVPWAQTPRRLGGDPTRPVMWVANWNGQSIAEIDTRTHEITLHEVPIPNASPYDVDVGTDHMVWVTLRNAGRVGRFNPDTREWTVFMLPTLGYEARHISVDRRRGDVWVPSWRTSKVARLQLRTVAEIDAATALVAAQ